MRGVVLSAIVCCLLILLNDAISAPTSLAKTGNRRGAGKELLKYGFKVLRMGSEVLPKVSSMTFVVSAAYSLIKDCCDGKYGDACKWTKETEAIQKEIETKGHEIDVIQLETKNLQDLLLSVNDQYESVIEEMLDISDETIALMNSLNPNLEVILDDNTKKLKEMVDKKTESEDVEYADIVEDFFNKIDAATNIAVFSMELAVPELPKVTVLGKRNMARRRSFKLRRGVRNPVRIRNPPKGSPESKGLKSWLSKEKAWVKSKVVDVRTKMSNRYRGAVEKVKNFADKFGILYGYVDAALTLYAAVENFRKCRTAYDEAKDAVTEMRNANGTLQEIYSNAVDARKLMFEARDQLKGNISSDNFLDDLTSLKTNMVDIQGGGNGLQDMIDGVEAYIRDIKSTDDFEEVARLVRQLYTSLGGFPFVYRCLRTKISFLSLSVSECKAGKKLQDIIDDNKNLFDVNNTDCQQKLGGKPLTLGVIQQVIDKAAEKGGFNNICALNNAAVIDKICSVRCEGKGKSAEQIAQKVPYPVNEIQKILPKCGSCLEKKKSIICMAKSYKPDITDQEIQNKFPMLTLEEIRSIDCSDE